MLIDEKQQLDLFYNRVLGLPSHSVICLSVSLTNQPELSLMKTRFSYRLLSTTILSMLLVTGCSYFSSKPGEPASKASPEAVAAIASANAAIKNAKANNWVWVNTEDFATDAQTAADKGDNAVAIQLANKAKAEAENAVAQYNYEKTHPRGL
jgi:hypothetical protein